MIKTTIKTTVAAAIILLFASASHAFFVEPAAQGNDPVDVIVIDPGHGGVDAGATGPGGLSEKEIVLGVAMGLKDALVEKLGITVLLTREDDTFVPLEERVAFASRSNADIFISIHVNAARNSKASGVETFFLSYEPTDAEAMRLAEQENRVVLPDGTVGTAPEAVINDLKNILHDLAQSVTHHESSALAEAVQVSMVRGTRRHDRGVKQAPFTVLGGASMPAVLVEVGFISNRPEAKWLGKKQAHKRIANAIAVGISEFAEMVNKRASKVKVNSDDRARR